MWKGGDPAVQAEPNRLTSQQQLCPSPFSSAAGISTMSVVTSPKERTNKSFSMLLKENRGGQEEVRHVRRGGHRYEDYKKSSR